MSLGTEAGERLAEVRKNRIRRPVVTAFGRLDSKLLAYVQQEAAHRQAMAVVFPIPGAAQRALPSFSVVSVNRNDRVRSLPDVLVALSLMGFDAAYVIVTRDQLKDVPALKAQAHGLKFKELGVLPVLTELIKENAKKKPTTVKEGQAFVLYALTKSDARQLHEAFHHHVKCPRVPLAYIYSGRTKHLMETGQPFYVDASGASMSQVEGVHALLERGNYATYIYAKEMPLPKVITEAWLNISTVYGLMREKYRSQMLVLSADASPLEMVEHVWKVLSEAETKAKTPSEVDQLTQKSKQETLLMKKRQSAELLGAKERELEKKSADDMAKLNATASN